MLQLHEHSIVAVVAGTAVHVVAVAGHETLGALWLIPDAQLERTAMVTPGVAEAELARIVPDRVCAARSPI